MYVEELGRVRWEKKFKRYFIVLVRTCNQDLSNILDKTVIMKSTLKLTHRRRMTQCETITDAQTVQTLRHTRQGQIRDMQPVRQSRNHHPRKQSDEQTDGHEQKKNWIEYSLDTGREDGLHTLVDFDEGATTTPGVKVGYGVNQNVMQVQGVAVDLDGTRQ